MTADAQRGTGAPLEAFGSLSKAGAGGELQVEMNLATKEHTGHTEHAAQDAGKGLIQQHLKGCHHGGVPGWEATKHDVIRDNSSERPHCVDGSAGDRDTQWLLQWPGRGDGCCSRAWWQRQGQGKSELHGIQDSHQWAEGLRIMPGLWPEQLGTITQEGVPVRRPV